MARGVRRGLVVCTANLCRSPVAARLLQRELDDQTWSITSAGLGVTDRPMDPNTVAAAAAAGIDLSAHSPRRLDATVLATDGADLVLAMTRAVMREVVAIDPQVWLRTFTLKELARLAAEAPPASSGESFEAWRGRLTNGRRTVDRVAPSDDDDVADPYGGPRRAHDRMVDELSRAVSVIARHGPWGSADGSR